MFIVLLKLTDNSALASQFMAGHNDWIQQGFEEGVFLLVGTLQPTQGGCILAGNTSLQALQNRVAADPLVAQQVATAEILQVTPHRADDRLGFLLG